MGLQSDVDLLKKHILRGLQVDDDDDHETGDLMTFSCGSNATMDIELSENATSISKMKQCLKLASREYSIVQIHLDSSFPEFIIPCQTPIFGYNNDDDNYPSYTSSNGDVVPKLVS